MKGFSLVVDLKTDTWSSLIVDAAPTALLMIDDRLTIVMANRAAEQLFGYARAELVGRPLTVLVPDRFRDAHDTQIFTQAGDVSTTLALELYGKRKDDTEVAIDMRVSTIDTPTGRFTLAACVDLSERRSAEAAERRLAALVASSDDAIIASNLDETITTWNAAATRLLGYASSEIIGTSWTRLVPAERHIEERAVLERVRRGESVRHRETVRIHKDGRTVHVATTVSPILDDHGATIGVSTIARDLTELRRNLELERSNSELEQFAYVASHDLQEPLRMVANYTELLAERYRGRLDERADKYINYASDGARRLQRLVNDLLVYARAGSQGIEQRPVVTEELFGQVVASLHMQIDAAAAVVTHDHLPNVLADKVQIAQLLQNLIGNAVKFRRADAPSRVHVSGTHRDGMCLFAVADNGIGLDAQHADRVFRMFQRLNPRSAYEGSGIGLALSKRIVERHGGSIWLESKVGHGTTVSFTLMESP